MLVRGDALGDLLRRDLTGLEMRVMVALWAALDPDGTVEINLSALGREWDVSRSSIQVAMRRLEGERLIRACPAQPGKTRRYRVSPDLAWAGGDATAYQRACEDWVLEDALDGVTDPGEEPTLFP